MRTLKPVVASSEQIQHQQNRLQEREARRVRSKRRRRTMRMMVVASGVFSFFGTLALVYFTKVLEPAQLPLPSRAPVVSTPKSVPVKGAADPDRPIFRYSIVPGGVRSAAEVARAMQLDPVVAAHYAHVIPASMRTETLPQAMSVNVSYRIGDKIYWTKKKLTLNAGEKILTDGTTVLRQRCGNILSMEPLGPQLEAEPVAPEFDVEIDPFMPHPGIMLYPPDPLITRGLPPGSPTPYSLEPPPPTPVPEPSTWMLVSIGIGLGATKIFRRKARQ